MKYVYILMGVFGRKGEINDCRSEDLCRSYVFEKGRRMGLGYTNGVGILFFFIGGK